MTTIRIKGSPSVNNWFAEEMVKDYGPDGARDKCAGPMLAAVERVIAENERIAAEAAKKESI